MYDLIIRNGAIIDGSGGAPFPADVGVIGDRIATVGRIREHAPVEIGAEGMVVSPGFIDGHTHMDAQIFWDPLGSSSCWHGITSVIMGHCGFTLAPASAAKKDLAVKNLERAEEISAQALAVGIPDWDWESFSEYIEVLDRLPKAINYATNIGHSALRTWVMGERAFESQANDEEIERMEREVRSAIRAGAFGFTTSRSPSHLTTDDRPVASRLASWNEVKRLVSAMTAAGGYIFELANEPAGSTGQDDQALRKEYFDRLAALSVETGASITFGVAPGRDGPRILEIIDNAVESRGARMFALVHSRGMANTLSFETQLPYDLLAEWETFRREPLAEQSRILKDPSQRERLIEAACRGAFGPPRSGAEARPPNYDLMHPLTSPYPPYKSIAELASESGRHPVEVVIDTALKHDLKFFFVQPFGRYELSTIEQMMRHPRTVMTFSDSGAHVSRTADASIQTYLLSYWVRENPTFTLSEAVRMVTFDPANAWGLHDRGLVREGFVADMNVFDPEQISPGMPEVVKDLPGGSKRIIQKAKGIAKTIVGGQVVFSEGEHTGALPGRILRSPANRYLTRARSAQGR